MKYSTFRSNDHSCTLPYPSAIAERVGMDGVALPVRRLFELLEEDAEATRLEDAIFYREVACHYDYCDKYGNLVPRNATGALLVDYDDWDELTPEQKLIRGNVSAATSLIDRLRHELDGMSHDPANSHLVDDIRRTLAGLVERF